MESVPKSVEKLHKYLVPADHRSHVRELVKIVQSVAEQSDEQVRARARKTFVASFRYQKLLWQV